ncbi:MAG: DUF692 domain-containing protein [Candidatus Thiodiazotropha sp. (ex Dulcina madagascariensis)]|nr:DUF692 domain-containing protein [Candidatus Thiodiazotropha sp. (ex Dulcina madagascariensis)]MCU7927720.1 DUF692 domain-containing protein [Candidatus Thiodiazotropha sp. (ex Dulcina madagascariensis)]
MKPADLGIGLVYIPGLEPLFESRNGNVQVLELEPQALWRYFSRRSQPYVNQLDLLERLNALPQKKIVHGVGFPVGGSRIPDPRHLEPFREAIEAIDAAWASEHLVFNEAQDPDGEVYQTGFFLPPLATPAGVEAATQTIRSVSQSLPVPFAVETPTNYLKSRHGQMSDGAFTAAVVERADCGILLDLHNIWTNERNGRQGVEEFLSEIPLERVWEIHLAGGVKYGDYWLDAHSGEIPRPVIEWARRLVPHLPSLGAVIFELLPAYLPKFGLDGVRRAVDELNELWALRCSPPQPDDSIRRSSPPVLEMDDTVSPTEWENALAEAILSDDLPTTPLGKQLAQDPAVPLIRTLNHKFRLSAVVANLRMSIRLLLLNLHEEAFDQLVTDYCLTIKPQRFAAAEARNFADYINSLELDIPYLDELLNYEITAIDVIADGRSRRVSFSVDPNKLLDALARGDLPENLTPADYEAEITPPIDKSFETQPLYH